MMPWCLPPSFCSIRLTLQEQITTEDFQDRHSGSHLEYPNKMILAILNLYVARLPLLKFQLHPNYSLGGHVVWKSKRKDFSNSESPCLLSASQKVSAKSYIPFGSSRWPFWNNFSSFESLCCSDASHKVLVQTDLWVLAGDMVWRISRWQLWWPSWIPERNNFSNSESPCLVCLCWGFTAQSTQWGHVEPGQFT